MGRHSVMEINLATAEEEGQEKEERVLKGEMTTLPRHTQPPKGSRKTQHNYQSSAK